MNQQLTVWLPEVLLLLILVVASIVIVAASVYDIQQKMRKNSIDKVLAKLRGSRQPFVTVLVYVQNSADNLEKCLDSIRRNRYSRYDVVVIDDSSSNGTRRKMRLFGQKHPMYPVRLYSKRQRGDRLESLRQGYRRSQKGDLLLILEASSTITPTFLKSSAARFVSDDKLNVIHFNIYNTSLHSITLLHYRFMQLSESLFRKFLSLVSKYQVKTLENGNMYRRSVFRYAYMMPTMTGRYDSELIVTDCLVDNDNAAISYLVSGRKNELHEFRDIVKSLSYFIIVISVLLLQTYSMYLAATLQSKTLLMIGWSAVVIWFLIATWSAETANVFDKIKLTFCVPIIYFLLYVQLIMFVIFKVISTPLYFGQSTDKLLRSTTH